MNIRHLLPILYVMTFPQDAFAYIDPGSGSIFAQAIIGIVVAGLFLIRIWWTKILALTRSSISKLFGEDRKE